MKGKIVKGISGFYYVHVAETGIYECKAKGIFRNQKIKPLVGDDVEIVVLDEEKKIGNVEKILEVNEVVRSEDFRNNFSCFCGWNGRNGFLAAQP